MKMYLDERVLFYTTRDWARLAKINSDTAKLQNELWAAVRPAATVRTTSIVVSLVISGMNEVLNSQGYTQAAWWNRIPIAAWALMAAIAICCNVLIGYGARRRDWHVFLILPSACRHRLAGANLEVFADRFRKSLAGAVVHELVVCGHRGQGVSAAENFLV